MFSQFADQQKVQEQLNNNPTLARFAHEFCHAFDVKLKESSNRDALNVLTPSGLHVGAIRVDMRGARDKDNNPVPVYYFSGSCIKKDRGSARSDSETRDSTKIKSLIQAMKKNGEAPTEDKLHYRFKQGIRYAFNTINSDYRSDREPEPHAKGNLALSLINNYLGVDTESVKKYDSDIRELVKEYETKLKQYNERNDAAQRFFLGAHLIGQMRGDKDYYVVGEVSTDPAKPTETDSIVIHPGLKRYASLSEATEIAHHIPIITAWANGKYPHSVVENTLGLPHMDRYHEDIDVATGYSNASEFWILIPKTAP